MMSKYIELELTPSKFGGGSFNCKASFKLDNMSVIFNNVDVKLDTGCALSTIPLKRLNVPRQMCERLKADDLDKGVDYVRSYGVETGGLRHFEPVTKKQKQSCKALKFKHQVSGMQLNGVDIPISDMYVNYNRSGNVLIGMDIISMMVWHSDISTKTGKFTLLCCPRNVLDDSFYAAMKEHFGIIRDI